ncbi:adenosylcobinamide-GDP ribazoletransferase [Bacteroides sp. 51]|uniref:adenosylcobinamide-GDP ribazoletransferase n=1 Tax=Bacteroides sp. 51 TaxID=2302938 RepID=UPI0013D08CD7|nr:adenosylcobinamide-GDP ribazoletransferase [Bacteroides sp. 51]NDV82011.1 adenosylcobinamide-GDP ribazoletransferase [Bacteroides sp. 51]
MRVLAAFIFFTRLPFWRIKEVPAAYFKSVVNYWPLVGWLTGGITATVLWAASLILPLSIALLLAIVSRLWITGALHEDGLADCFDGFGGGTTKERTLMIMKDSHIGSYGVIGLIFYFLLLWGLLMAIPFPLVCLVIIAGDVWGKFVAAQLINVLPYARKEEEAKIKVVYNRMNWSIFLFTLICGITPLLTLLPPHLWIAALLPLLVFFLLYRMMKKRLQGYTGDCCGATVLLCELSFYLGVVLLTYNQINILNP